VALEEEASAFTVVTICSPSAPIIPVNPPASGFGGWRAVENSGSRSTSSNMRARPTTQSASWSFGPAKYGAKRNTLANRLQHPNGGLNGWNVSPELTGLVAVARFESANPRSRARGIMSLTDVLSRSFYKSRIYFLVLCRRASTSFRKVKAVRAI
jgi:predicted dienelactone hydrolase